MPRTIWTVLLLLMAFQPAVAGAADFVVATSGNDAHPGTAEKPFATLQRARDAVRQKRAEGAKGDVTVVIRGGTYRLDAPVVFGPEDGGAGDSTVTYRAAEGETPIFSGGRPITGWREAADGNWIAEVPEARAGKWDFRQLFVNGRRAARARHPNDGYLRVETIGADRRTNFTYAAGDLRAYDDLDRVELVFLHDWSITRVPVQSIDQASRTLRVVGQIGGPGSWCTMDRFEKHPRYFLENSAAFLDQPGEWFLDTAKGTVTYRPRPGQRIDRIEAIAPVAKQLLVVRGDVEGGRPVRNLRFAGLVLEHAAWAPPGGTYWGRQACTYWSPAVQVPDTDHNEADPAAVQFDAAEGCQFVDGQVRHVGRSGIWLGRQCQGNAIVGCIVSDCGGNGVMIGEGKARMLGTKAWWEVKPEQAARANRLSNTVVQRCGQELFGAVGIWVGLAAETTLTHNEVRNHPYTGVSVGWMWWRPTERPEPRKTPCERTVVDDNHIHHTMLMLSDGGCIYALGNQPESSLRGNHIHDVSPNAGRAESNGMFLDQGTGGFTIRENTIYNIARSPLRFHKGWKNLVTENLLVVRAGVPPVRYNDTKVERIRLVDNAVVERITPEVIQAAARRAGLEPNYRRLLDAAGEE